MILVDTKPMAMTAIKAASGKQAGCGTKVIKVKWELGKRKARADSELEDGVVKGKGGRIWGAVNWEDQDFTTLLDTVEELLVVGKKAWGEVCS